MKRTVEFVLTIIGAVLYGILAAFGGLLKWIQGNEQVMTDFENALEEDPTLSETGTDVGTIMDAMNTGATTILTVSILVIVLGIIALFLLKGNKKPIAAGIILIIAGAGSVFFTYGLGLFGAIFYVIAGIMAVVRKPKTLIE
ncbi:DUF4064 domain-containing protein [Radiobacillus kanasensis]|uniref:DUF4064 domain-containing protein n=1 Tax=Radiobacillus kanasensis TaxID=2844358 RepID=UPI001E36BF76|nr:DUF4064 domain-containing protein [Radiobacillus kanasensis]UFT99733.1 DUF4064 domain-containing protein [Radiobacillus kanasensis]